MRTSVTGFTIWVRFKYLDSIIMFGRGRGRNTKMGAGSRNIRAGKQKNEGRGAEI